MNIFRDLFESKEKREKRRAKEIKEIKAAIAALKNRGLTIGPNLELAALIKIGVPAVEPLIAALKEKKWEVRMDAAKALGEIKDTRAIEPLVTAFIDSTTEVHWAAEAALEKVDPNWAKSESAKGTIPSLIAALKDSKLNVRENAAELLDKLGWQPDQSNHAVWYWIASRKFEKCIEIGTPAIEPLIEMLKDLDVYQEAVVTLIKIGTPAIEPLIPSLMDDQPYHIRNIVARALEKLGWQPTDDMRGIFYVLTRNWSEVIKAGSAAIEPIIELVNNKSTNVGETRAAQDALVSIISNASGDPYVLELLVSSILLEQKKSRENWVMDEIGLRLEGVIGEKKLKPVIEKIGKKLGVAYPHLYKGRAR